MRDSAPNLGDELDAADLSCTAEFHCGDTGVFSIASSGSGFA
jgi:hypothetical protein